MLYFDDFLANNPIFRKFAVDELLFTAYDCPIEGSPVDYFVEKNYFCHVFKGGARWKTPEGEYTLNVGDAAFLKKGAHRVYKILNGDFCALLIFIPDEFIRAVVINDIDIRSGRGRIEPTDSVIPLESDRTLTDYFNTMLTYFTMPDPPSGSLLKIRFKELIVNIVTSNRNHGLTNYFYEVCRTGKRSLKLVMEENFTFNLKMEDFARLSDRSLTTFNRDFVKTYGCTPGRWLKHKRLDYGKYLLETTDLNINEITLEVGFGNTSHFIRSFKNHFKNSPLKFKKVLEESTA